MNMRLTEFLEKWGRTVFESPLARTAPLESPPELAEIRFAVLDEVRRNSYRAGARQVFPFDLVRVRMRGVEESRAPVFRSGFFRLYLEHEIQGTLRAENVRFPEQLRVEVEISTGLPLPNEPWLTVSAESQEQPAESERAACLRVQRGSANLQELPIAKRRVHIGREPEVYVNGGIRRRNDLAFAEENEVNRSVSREHAHIDYDRVTGEYRLFNDRWYARGTDCATRIVRDGVSVEVHRDTRGTRLESGDEIHLGGAIVTFTV
jgi:FHA domain